MSSYRPGYTGGQGRGGGREQRGDRRERFEDYPAPARRGRYDDNPALDRPLGDNNRYRDDRERERERDRERDRAPRDGRVGSYHASNRDTYGSGYSRRDRSRSPPAPYPSRRRGDTPPPARRYSPPRQQQQRRPISPAPSSARRRSRSPSSMSQTSNSKRQAVRQTSPPSVNATLRNEATTRPASTSRRLSDIDIHPKLPASPLEDGERQDSPLPTSLGSSTSTRSIRGTAATSTVPNRPTSMIASKGDARAVASSQAATRQQSSEPRRAVSTPREEDERSTGKERERRDEQENDREQNELEYRQSARRVESLDRYETDRHVAEERSAHLSSSSSSAVPAIPKGPRGYQSSSFYEPVGSRRGQGYSGQQSYASTSTSSQYISAGPPGVGRPNPLKMPPRDKAVISRDEQPYRENAFSSRTAAESNRNDWPSRDREPSYSNSGRRGGEDDRWAGSASSNRAEYSSFRPAWHKPEARQSDPDNSWTSGDTRTKEDDPWGPSASTTQSRVKSASNESTRKSDSNAWGTSPPITQNSQNQQTEGWGTPVIRTEKLPSPAWGDVDNTGKISSSPALQQSGAWTSTSPMYQPPAAAVTATISSGGAWGDASPAYPQQPPHSESSPATHTSIRQDSRRPDHRTPSYNQAGPPAFRPNYHNQQFGRSNPLKIPPKDQQQRSPNCQNLNVTDNAPFATGGGAADVSPMKVKPAPRPSLCPDVDEVIEKLRKDREDKFDPAYLNAAKETRRVLRELEVLESESLAISLNRMLRKEQLAKYKEDWMVLSGSAMEVDVVM